MLRLGLLLIIKVSAVAMLLFSLVGSSGLPVSNPWFDISVMLWIFSAVVGGMPEPEEDSSFYYIWLYRSLHLLSATGTAYFIHKKRWADISGESKTKVVVVEEDCK
jgi:hypothetical protein